MLITNKKVKKSFKLSEINCSYLHPSMVFSFFEGVFSSHRQTDKLILIGCFLFPTLHALFH